MNLVILKGNITRDLELAFTAKGVPVLEIGLAVNKVWFNDAGEKQEKVCFVDCRAWRKTAESIEKHFRKGSPILIQGELAIEEWIDKATEKKRRKTLVMIDRFEFCGESKTRSAPEEPPDRARRPEPREAAESSRTLPDPDGPITDGLEDDDIPF
jgi:single-strand DNA-binding protein